jgi:hypothetical protein
MKNLLVVLVGLFLLTGCGECDNSNFYQIRNKDDDTTPKMCRFKAEGLGPCASWQGTQGISFSDSCRRFALSQIVRRDIIMSYQ